MHNPVWLFVSLAQPIYYLVLFGPLLRKVTNVQGFPGGGAFNVFVPGLLIQLALFGCAFVGFSLIAEMRYGVIERLQVTPISRAALLLGRAGRDVASLLVQVLILVLLAWPFGLHLNVGGLAVAFGLLVFVGLAFSAISYTLALVLKSEDAPGAAAQRRGHAPHAAVGHPAPVVAGARLAAGHRRRQPADATPSTPPARCSTATCGTATCSGGC